MANTSDQQSFRDTSLSPETRAEKLVEQMTVAEKVSQMLHSASAVERLGIREYNWWNEALHGAARAGKATVYPQAISMAASFDTDLMYQVSSAIADEVRAKHHTAAKHGLRTRYFGLTCWSPNVNIFRHPLWGRGHETYGEDPYLTARMGVAFCKGLQGNHPRYLKTIATPKHYAVHSGPENERHEFNAVVSNRDLYETYLRAFKACIEEADARSVMGAYNRTNDEPCCASKTLLQDILRDEWRFKGYVVSDCGAICDIHKNHQVTNSPEESAAMAVKNGCELNCGVIYDYLLKAVEQNLISEEQVDNAVKKLMEARVELGDFDPEENLPASWRDSGKVCCEKHKHLALDMARESIVLLKNDADTLPLSKDVKGIGVIGPTAMNQRMQLANYYGLSPRVETITEGIVNLSSPGTKVNYAKGCDVASDNPIAENDIGEMGLEDLEVVVAVVGNTADIEGEEGGVAASDGGGDRQNLSLPGRQQELLERLAELNKPLILVLTTGGAVDLTWAEKNCDAIINAGYPGEAGGRAVAEVIFGEYNPAGRLPVTFPASLDQLPPFDNYDMMNGHTYRFMVSEPLYPFGFGLSYTTFAYDRLGLSCQEISKDQLSEGQMVNASVEVTNTGRMGGEEVVQLYVSDQEASVPVPQRHLEGFERIYLAPGETKTVSFNIGEDQLCVYDENGACFVEAGDFTIALGGGQPNYPSSGAVSTTISVV